MENNATEKAADKTGAPPLPTDAKKPTAPSKPSAAPAAAAPPAAAPPGGAASKPLVLEPKDIALDAIVPNPDNEGRVDEDGEHYKELLESVQALRTVYQR